MTMLRTPAEAAEYERWLTSVGLPNADQNYGMPTGDAIHPLPGGGEAPLPTQGKKPGSWFDQNAPAAAASSPMAGVLSQGSGMGSAPGGGFSGQFVAPSGVDMENDPGYRFRLDEQQRAIQNSQFSRGQGLTGGALRDLARYQGGLASQEYGNVFNRALQTEDFNRGTAWGNTDRSLAAYLASRDTSWGDSDRLFGRNFSLATLGANSALGYGTNLGQYGAGATDLYTGIGNSRAAGAIGVGNAVSGGIERGSSMAALLALQRQQRGGGVS